MSTASVTSLVDALRQHRLLDAKQLEELTKLDFPDPKALAKELIRRNWLTPYQANQLLQGKGQELLLGQYIILERLGEGGMGQVFKVRHRNLNRIAALKLIRKEKVDSPDAIRRFQREVRAAAQLNHPNVVLAHDADQIGGTHLLVMEYIEGANDLNKLVKKNGPLPVEKACEYIRQAALGLQHAHEMSMVHRDIKPHNLLLTADGKTVKILDMGLARLDHANADDKSSTAMTQEGAIMGTPDYITPEQALDSHTADIRADIYSLGCTLYYLLTARVPFQGGTLTEKLLKHQMQKPKAVEELRPDVPPAVLAVVRKMMVKKPEERYQTPGAVAAALANVAKVESDQTIAASGSVPVQAKSGDTLDSALSYMAGGGDLAQAEALRSERAAEGRREWKKLRWAGVVGVLGLVVLGLIVAFLPKGKPPSPPDQELKEIVKPDEPKEIDLLALIDPTKHAVKGRGEWKFEGKTLVAVPSEPAASLQIPISPPEEYELELVAERRGEKESSLVIGLLAGQNQCVVVLDGDVHAGCGLQLIDGKPFNRNETANPKQVFTNRQPARISCIVRKRNIVAICDGKTIINWRGDFRRLSFTNHWRVPAKDKLFIGMGSSVFHITKMVLRPLPDSEKAFNDWLASVQKMPADKQVEAVAAKLKELNPGFDGKVTPKIEGGMVTVFSFWTDNVTDISPVRALTGLKVLDCSGSAPSKSRLIDLTPLKAMKLTSLSCYWTQVADLSPLKQMPLTNLSCWATPVADLSPLKDDLKLTSLLCGATLVADLSPLKGKPLTFLTCNNTPVTDLTPLEGMKLEDIRFTPNNISKGMDVLRQMKSLKTIGIGWDKDSWPAAEFWKRCDAGEFNQADPKQAAFDAWCKQVAVMSAEKQVEAVAAKLKELNPGFDGTLEHKVEGGAVTYLRWQRSGPTVRIPITDISPVRALPGLVALRCDHGPLGDLSPLRGMKLRVLNVALTKVFDLSPLQGMPLAELYFHNSPVSDLSPLKRLQLARLNCADSKVSDLTPLEGMKLEDIRFTPKNTTKGMDVIRQMKSLKTVGIGWEDKDKWPADEFWKKYDAGEFR